MFAALFIASVILLQDHPAAGASAEEIADWYLRERKVVALIGLYLVPFAGIAFLWFIAVIRDQVGVREDRFLSTVFLGSGLLFVAMLFAAAASTGGLIDSVALQGAPPPSPDMVVLARSTGHAFIYVFGVRDGGRLCPGFFGHRPADRRTASLVGGDRRRQWLWCCY